MFWYFNGAPFFYMILVQYRTYISYLGTKIYAASSTQYQHESLTKYVVAGKRDTTPTYEKE